MEEKKYKYNGFISYLQNPDKKLAIAIRNGLMELGAKKHLLRFRALEIFRDESSATVQGDLRDRIQQGLKDSKYFVLLARPEATKIRKGADRNWIEEELKYWINERETEKEKRKTLRELNIIICIVDGSIEMGDHNHFISASENCLPEILNGRLSGIEKYVDLRYLKEKLKNVDTNNIPKVLSLKDPDFLQKIAEISGQIQGKTVDELIAEDRRRQQLWSNILTAGLMSLLLLTGIALYEYNQAKKNQQKAEQNLKNYEYKTVEELIDNARTFKRNYQRYNDQKSDSLRMLNLDSAKHR